MLIIPIDTGKDVTVEVNDDGRIHLTIPLELGEFVGPVRSFEEPRSKDPVVILDALRERISYLEDRLVDARCEHDLERELLPEEARSIAAALVHHAGEVESLGRRP